MSACRCWRRGRRYASVLPDPVSEKRRALGREGERRAGREADWTRVATLRPNPWCSLGVPKTLTKCSWSPRAEKGVAVKMCLLDLPFVLALEEEVEEGKVEGVGVEALVARSSWEGLR